MATGLRFWDRLILFVAWTVTCGLVYLLGFYVGKGVQERREAAIDARGLRELVGRHLVRTTRHRNGAHGGEIRLADEWSQRWVADGSVVFAVGGGEAGRYDFR